MALKIIIELENGYFHVKYVGDWTPDQRIMLAQRMLNEVEKIKTAWREYRHKK